MPAVSFSAFIWAGNTLDLAMALTAIDYFSRLMWGIGKWPETHRQFGELVMSFGKI